MEMQEIKNSSNVAAIGYDPDKREMRVDFMRGGRYLIHDVEQEVFDAFLKAESAGKFYAKNIRGIYGYKKLEAED